MHDKLFLLSDAAEAAGVTTHAVRAWLTRKTIWFDEGEMVAAEGNGLPHRINFLGVMRIAIMSQLVAIGIPPSKAWKGTMAFTDIGDSGFVIGDVRMDPDRGPGELYKDGYTVLAVYADEDFGRVFKMLPETPLQDLFFPPAMSTSRKTVSAALVINFVERQIKDRLAAKAGE